ncbi:MAG: LuxR C-terminal-related transcriptional regulator [Nitrospira sp.]|nr:LuxR C-terminal-related transcriptional regulator [Nitrospira sp.]
MPRTAPKPYIPNLNPREFEALHHLWDGLQYKEIATVMKLSTKTVKNYLHTTYAKLRVETNVQAVRRGLELGILKVTARPWEDWP